eukprot:sb/3470385/
MLMNEEFDCIKEEKARQESWGTESPQQVGWGSKETQFHGSAGKVASQQPVFASLTPIAAHDTEETRVTWRGDGHYFAVSTVDDVAEAVAARVVRVWTRDGVHTATNEPVPGLEDALSWRPSGNLIATTAMQNNQHQSLLCRWSDRQYVLYSSYQYPYSSYLTYPPTPRLYSQLLPSLQYPNPLSLDCVSNPLSLGCVPGTERSASR